jgi:hypothetical protein
VSAAERWASKRDKRWASKRDKQRRVMNIFSTTALHSLLALPLSFANYSISVLNEDASLRTLIE